MTSARMTNYLLMMVPFVPKTVSAAAIIFYSNGSVAEILILASFFSPSHGVIAKPLKP